ncbi:uncharacterized protein METZ01_LOCUS433722, partial [marine metagenome]
MSIDQKLPVTEADIARYQRDGALCIRKAFDRHWVD